MMLRILNSKNLVAFVLAVATGMTLYFRVPFPEGNIFLRVMALRSPSAFEVLKYSYTLFLFSTPYIGYSVLFSGLYIFGLKAKQRIRAGKLPLFPNPWKRNDLSSSSGSFTARDPQEEPVYRCCHPRRNRVRKTTCRMYPFAEQILAYRAGDTQANPAASSEEQKRLP